MNRKFEVCGMCQGEEGHVNTDGDWVDCWHCGGQGGFFEDVQIIDPTAPNYEAGDEEAA